MFAARQKQGFCALTLMVVHFYLHAEQMISLSKICSLITTTTKSLVKILADPKVASTPEKSGVGPNSVDTSLYSERFFLDVVQ